MKNLNDDILDLIGDHGCLIFITLAVVVAILVVFATKAEKKDYMEKCIATGRTKAECEFMYKNDRPAYTPHSSSTIFIPVGGSR